MPLAYRITATVVGVAGFAALAVHRFVLQAMFWRTEPASTGVWLSSATLGIALLGPLLVYLGLTWRRLRPPAAFQRGAGGAAFTVSGSPALPGFLAILLMLQAGNALPYEKVPGTDRIGLPADPVLQWFFALPALEVLLALAVLWLPRTALRLTPAGITVRNVSRVQEIAWDDLLPGGPQPGRQWMMRLRFRGPGGDPRSCRVALFLFSVDGAFLASVVRHYAERPEHRADIGTEGELERLRSGFGQRVPQPAA
ncbi:PH domain-containing protein [Dactylosporangium sp. NPDC000244]|uniref:PH domain-containing protein n=1 Tax=Dactylosporangium sp. NPDC000244 TaxID=3154365 RepID=UPI00331DED41